MGTEGATGLRPTPQRHGYFVEEVRPGEAEASGVLDEIGRIRSDFRRGMHDGTTIGHRRRSALHYAFIRAYYHSTEGWLEFARKADSGAFLHTLIVSFFAIYKRDVHSNIMQTGSTPVPHHWRPYFDLARKAAKRPEAYVRALGLFFGARAHVRFDLGMALVDTYLAFDARGEAVPELDTLRGELLGVSSSQLFSGAARRYFAPFDEHVTDRLPPSQRIAAALVDIRVAEAI